VTERAIVPSAGAEELERRIFTVRGHRVMLDEDLARLYGVTTKRRNEQVGRNPKRFPDDFAFRLTPQEVAILRSQNATSSLIPAHGGRRYLPRVFTEHGALMLSAVLSSPVAVNASIAVVRAFVRLRELVAGHRDLVRRLDTLEKKYDSQFRLVFAAVRALMAGERPENPRDRIGFR
jgi:hypothetical protein